MVLFHCHACGELFILLGGHYSLLLSKHSFKNLVIFYLFFSSHLQKDISIFSIKMIRWSMFHAVYWMDMGLENPNYPYSYPILIRMLSTICTIFFIRFHVYIKKYEIFNIMHSVGLVYSRLILSHRKFAEICLPNRVMISAKKKYPMNLKLSL